MAKIVSRVSEEQALIEDLQELLADASRGALGLPGTGAMVDLETTVPGLVEQTAAVLNTMHETMEILHLRSQMMAADNVLLTVELDTAQEALANLIGNIDYDEAMDHATADLMDGFCSSGAADVNADGELVFDTRVSFTKEDLKPMLREAIVRWVELKMSQ